MDASLRQHRERFRADPDATAAFEVLEEHLFMEQAWPELAALYRRRLEAPSLAQQPAARAQLQLRLGQTLEERCADSEGALTAYAEAARLEPRLRPALQALRRLYTARRSWEMVLQIAELEASAARDADERARILTEMGDVWQRELGDPEQAEELYARARAESGAGGAPAEEPAEALVQQAWLAAARGDSAAALSSLRDALARNPGDLDAIDMMITVLEGAERHAEMAELLERRAAMATDPQTRSAVWVRLGAVREDPLGDLGGARSAYEHAVEADPANLGARAALARVLRQSEAWDPLRALLEAGAREGPEAGHLGALCELADLLEERFGDTEGAVSSWRRALELAPDHPRAREALDRLTAAPAHEPPAARPAEGGVENRSLRIAEVLERRLEAFESRGAGCEPDAVALRLRIAELRADTLGDLGGAIEVLEPALADDEALGQVAPRLAPLYERTDRPQELAALAKRAATLAPEAAPRADWYRLAAETARRSGDAELAVECYARVLEESPRDRNAEAALLDLYRARGDTGRLVALLRARLPRSRGELECEVHLEIADLLEGRGDALGAFAHLRRALELSPEPEELLAWALSAANRSGGELTQLDLLDHLAAVVEEPRARAGLLAQRGALLADTLGWHPEATASWRLSLALDPDQPVARARLASPAQA